MTSRVNLRTLETPTEPTPYVPIAEAAKTLGIAEASIRRAIKRGEGAKFGGDTIGSRYIIRRYVFDRYLRGENDAAVDVAS